MDVYAHALGEQTKPRAILVVGVDSNLRGRLRAAFRCAQEFAVRFTRDPVAAGSGLSAMPAVVVFGGSACGVDDVDGIRALCLQFPSAVVLALARRPTADGLIGAVQAGAAGYIDAKQPASSIVANVRAALNGESPVAGCIVLEAIRKLLQTSAGNPQIVLRKLTTRQTEILHLVARAHTNKEIAGALGLSEQTVANHMKAILRRLDVHRRSDAAWLLQGSLQTFA